MRRTSSGANFWAPCLSPEALCRIIHDLGYMTFAAARSKWGRRVQLLARNELADSRGVWFLRARTMENTSLVVSMAGYLKRCFLEKFN